MRPALRWLAGGLLIAAGLALIGHGWWSGIEEANAQRILAAEVPKAAPAADTPAAPPPSVSPAPPAPPLVPLGGWRPPGPTPQVYATLEVPALGLRTFVVRGATLTDYYDLLAWGPAHLTGTAEPGAAGNAVIFGHVDEFGAPFRHLARLRPGDRVALSRGPDRYEYAVRSVRTVAATDLGVVADRPGVRALTLFTCGGPANSQRVVVYATLVGMQAPAPGGAPG
jgi:sortase A